MTKHTPGPWKNAAGVVSGGGHAIAVTSNAHHVTEWGTLGEIEANANLIAAAPNMLTGHEHIIMHAEDRCDCGRSYGDIARAAIAKAEGETE